MHLDGSSRRKCAQAYYKKFPTDDAIEIIVITITITNTMAVSKASLIRQLTFLLSSSIWICFVVTSFIIRACINNRLSLLQFGDSAFSAAGPRCWKEKDFFLLCARSSQLTLSKRDFLFSRSYSAVNWSVRRPYSDKTVLWQQLKIVYYYYYYYYYKKYC